MKAKNITEKWLQSLKLEQKSTFKGPTISGMYLKELIAHVDDRGDVIELWSTAWDDYKSKKVAKATHSYQSATDPGVVKCWHLHEIHTDQFTVTRGKLQVVVIDIREKSKSFGEINSFIMGVQKPRFLVIPPGLLHGWKALGTTESIVVNFQTHPFDPSDEYKFRWDCIASDVWGPRNG